MTENGNLEIGALAGQLLEEALGEELELLHSLPHMEGTPGIVWNEERARATPCHCTNDICFSRGIIGTLSAEQRTWACNPRLEVERPGLRRRMERWRQAVEKCRARLQQEAPVDGPKRIETWLTCMSAELRGLRDAPA